MANEKFWIYDPSVLYKQLSLVPVDTMTFTAKLNAITRSMILLAVILLLLNNTQILLIPVAVIVVAIIVYFYYNGNNTHTANPYKRMNRQSGPIDTYAPVVDDANSMLTDPLPANTDDDQIDASNFDRPIDYHKMMKPDELLADRMWNSAPINGNAPDFATFASYLV